MPMPNLEQLGLGGLAIYALYNLGMKLITIIKDKKQQQPEQKADPLVELVKQNTEAVRQNTEAYGKLLGFLEKQTAVDDEKGKVMKDLVLTMNEKLDRLLEDKHEHMIKCSENCYKKGGV
jgi:hypothetical protein